MRDAISAFYKGAGVDKQFSGEVNERVAEVFGTMLTETKKCSNAFVWVPTPSGGPATIAWIARNITRSVIERLRDSTSITCAKRVISVWDRELRMASMGL